MPTDRQLILVIDDNEIDRRAVAGLVRDRYNIAEASTGREGLALLKERRPDCVLLEHRLPDFDGLDMVQKLRDHDTAVVMLGGVANESVALKALKAGARDFVVKDSMTRDSLRLAVGTAIDKQKSQSRLERYRLAIESMPVGVVLLHRTGTGLECVASNVAASHALGVAPAELRGAALLPVMSKALGVAIEPTFLQVLADGQTQLLPEWRRTEPGRPDELWDIKVARLSDAELILTMDNITVRVDAATKQTETDKLLLTAQRLEAVGLMASGVAHDFNNFLTVILGYADVARLATAKPQAVTEALAQIHRAASRAADVTRQLLAFSRQQNIAPKLLDLNAVIVDMTKMLRRLIGEQVDFRTVPGADLWKINADPSQVEQVVMNLAVNSRDAMPGGGKITLETRNIELDAEYCRTRAGLQPGPYVELAFSDTGVGMDAATQARIFEPFFTTKGPDKGTGLGLTTVYGIVKQTHGHIALYTEPGKGTTFRVYWPGTTGKAHAHPATGAHAKLPRGAETILLAEDEEQVRTLMTDVLTGCGYKVISARDGAEALSLAASHKGPISLLITDVVMPRLGGRELALQFKLLRPRVRVLYASGYTAQALIHQGVPESGLNFLAKPYMPQDLAREVREILDGRNDTGPV